jgi:hypothetical protein
VDQLSLTPLGAQGPVGDGGACAVAEEHVHLDQLHIFERRFNVCFMIGGKTPCHGVMKLIMCDADSITFNIV